MRTGKEIKQKRHELIDIYKMSKGCEICGYNKFPYNLQFDHLKGQEKSEHVKNGYSKRSSAGGMFRLYSKCHSVEELISEIKKCRILCGHCHMEITHSIRNKRNIHNTTEHINSIEELNNRTKSFELIKEEK